MAVTLTNTFGVTVTVGASPPVFRLRGVRVNPGERNVIDTSHLGLTAFDSGVSAFGTSIPGGIIRGGTIELDVIWGFDEDSGTNIPPLSKGVDTILVTFVGSGVGGTDASFSVSGYITTYNIEGGDDTEWTGTVSCAITGNPTFVEAS